MVNVEVCFEMRIEWLVGTSTELASSEVQCKWYVTWGPGLRSLRVNFFPSLAFY